MPISRSCRRPFDPHFTVAAIETSFSYKEFRGAFVATIIVVDEGGRFWHRVAVSAGLGLGLLL
jgi:hypothetical protein